MANTKPEFQGLAAVVASAGPARGIAVSVIVLLCAFTASAQLLPDQDLTPGAARSSSHETICSLKSTKDARHVTESLKRKVYARYRATKGEGLCKWHQHGKSREGCEVDHLISLELGGANDITNLWPQPYHPRPGAHEKDWLENKLHRMICKGEISVGDAQTGIAKDWWALYQRFHK